MKILKLFLLNVFLFLNLKKYIKEQAAESHVLEETKHKFQEVFHYLEQANIFPLKHTFRSLFLESVTLSNH